MKSINTIVKKMIGLTKPKTAIAIRYFHGFKKFPNLKNPVTFNEKINAYKFMGDKYEFHKYADKVAVKDFVSKKIGSQHIIPTMYAGAELPPLNERTWEMPYVIKMNHGSGWNILVRNEKERNWPEIEKKIAKWSKTTFGRDTGEIHYSKIPPLVMVEKFISEEEGVIPKDYKVFVFNGKTEFIEVVTDREHNHAASLYDNEWNRLDFSFSDSGIYSGTITKPKSITKIIEFAETISRNFPFVRADFYDVNDHIYFGEITFTPSAGFAKFTPAKFDTLYGDKLFI